MGNLWQLAITVSGICPVYYHMSRHVRNTHNIYTYMTKHTHTMLPQLPRVTCFCQCDPCLLSLQRKAEPVSGYSQTSVTHIFSFQPFSLSDTQTLNLSQSVSRLVCSPPFIKQNCNRFLTFMGWNFTRMCDPEVSRWFTVHPKGVGLSWGQGSPHQTGKTTLLWTWPHAHNYYVETGTQPKDSPNCNHQVKLQYSVKHHCINSKLTELIII